VKMYMFVNTKHHKNAYLCIRIFILGLAFMYVLQYNMCDLNGFSRQPSTLIVQYTAVQYCVKHSGDESLNGNDIHVKACVPKSHE
jgi:hypothetical protein